MPNEKFMSSLLNHATVDGSKSTVLKPLSWAIVIILPTIIGSAYLKVAMWITIMFSTLLCLLFLLFIGAYIYFMLNDSDALRSEKYSLKKMEIQSTLLGDSDNGMKEVPRFTNEPKKESVLEIQGNKHE